MKKLLIILLLFPIIVIGQQVNYDGSLIVRTNYEVDAAYIQVDVWNYELNNWVYISTDQLGEGKINYNKGFNHSMVQVTLIIWINDRMKFYQNVYYLETDKNSLNYE